MDPDPATPDVSPALPTSNSTPSGTPLQGSFQEVSSVSRSQSASPRKRHKQPLHIRMNLTETQVDKLTDAFTSSRQPSPSSSSRHSAGSSSPRPKGARMMPPKHRKMFSWTSADGDHATLKTPVVGELAPSWPTPSHSETLAERRQHSREDIIRINEETQGPKESMKPRIQRSVDVPSPLELRYSTGASRPDSSPSTSSPVRRHPSQEPEPLRILPRSTYQPSDADNSEHLGQINDPIIRIQSASSRSNQMSPRRAKSNAEYIQRYNDQLLSPWSRAPAVPSKAEVMASKESPLFSPLGCYFQGPDFPTEKRGGKILIGDNGWLERTDSSRNKNTNLPVKKMGILENIKKIAKDMSELGHGRRANLEVHEVNAGSITCSLDAREQSLMYCELEFHLTNNLNTYIISQLERGNLVPQKLQRVAEAWHAKGRPRVAGFRYDLENQLELLELHVDEFVFHGRRQSNPSEISGLLYTMKVNARAMGVRTFCQPDSVIAKQLIDAQSLFNLIGVDSAQDRALKEIAQFFKVIVDRELKDPRRASKDDPTWMQMQARSQTPKHSRSHSSPRR